MDAAQTQQQAGDECMRVADDYTAIGEHTIALMFVRQAQVHYERAAALRAEYTTAEYQSAGYQMTESAPGTTEAA